MIFFASSPSVLGDCVAAALKLLTPFAWQVSNWPFSPITLAQSVYIPVLPPCMLDMVCAPMPFVAGVLSMHSDQVMAMPMEEVVLVDLDSNTIVSPFKDYEALPFWLREDLTFALQAWQFLSHLLI